MKLIGVLVLGYRVRSEFDMDYKVITVRTVEELQVNL